MDTQFGSKVGKHARDYGLDPANPADRAWIKGHIEEITRNPEEVKQGPRNPQGDGDSVRIHNDAWIDPFAEPLSPANEDYVRTSGKWTKCDVSDEAPFAHLVGRKLIDVAPMPGATGKLYGLLLNASGYLLAIYANADELHVRLLTQ